MPYQPSSHWKAGMRYSVVKLCSFCAQAAPVSSLWPRRLIQRRSTPYSTPKPVLVPKRALAFWVVRWARVRLTRIGTSPSCLADSSGTIWIELK